MKESYVWNKNEIMKMLGTKTPTNFVGNPEVETVKETFRNLPGAEGSFYKLVCSHCFGLLFSLYELGRIHGIRAERERIKKKAARATEGKGATV